MNLLISDGLKSFSPHLSTYRGLLFYFTTYSHLIWDDDLMHPYLYKPKAFTFRPYRDYNIMKDLDIVITPLKIELVIHHVTNKIEEI